LQGVRRSEPTLLTALMFAGRQGICLAGDSL
jgi:hypothetical protein